MARLRLLVAAALAAGALAVLAGPATASVPVANAKFCKAADDIEANTASSGALDKHDAETALKQFKHAAKYAPHKVKRAMRHIAKYLEEIADADNVGDLAKVNSREFTKYTKSISTYVRYYSKQCI